MSQKLGFPYMGLSINSLIFFLGLIFAVVFFVGQPAVFNFGDLIQGLLSFVGVFLIGWALLGYAVSRELTPTQRLTATFFAFLTLTAVLGVNIGFLLAVT